MPDGKKLSEQNRAKLDGIVQKMIQNNESEESISFVVNDFKSKYGEKKKDGSNVPSSSSTVQKPILESETQTKSGSSGTPQIKTLKQGEKIYTDKNIPSETKTQKLPALPKNLENVITNPVNVAKSQAKQEEEKAKKLEVANSAYEYALSNVDKSVSEKRYNNEVNNYQFLDGVKQGLKNFYNTAVVGPANAINSLFETKPLEKISKYKPLEKELKEAKKQLQEELGPKATITNEQIQQKAKDIFIQNDVQEQMHSKIDEFLPSDYDREGVWKELKLKELNSNALLKSKVVSAEVFKSQLEEFQNFAKSMSGKTPTEQDVLKYNELKDKATFAVDGLNYLAKNFDNYLKEAKTDGEKLELFKYNYDNYEKNSKLLYGSVMNIAGGSVKLLAETSKFVENELGLPSIGTESASELGSEVMNDAKKMTDPFYKYKATKLNSWSDLGSYASQLASEQIPILASIYLGGTGGVAGVSMSSGGQKINELEEQAKKPFGRIYSDGEKLTAGWLYAGAEFIPEKLGTARILKDMERTISSASSASRRLFRDNFMKETVKGLGKFGYYSGLEGGTEYLTAEGQIGIDRELLDIVKTDFENNEQRAESFFAGAGMGGGMSIAGGALGFAASQAKLYSESKDIKEVQSILSNIDKINSEIENNPLLTEKEVTDLYKEMNSLSNKAFETISKNANKGTEFSVEEKSALLDINLAQNDVKAKFKEIQNSNFSKEIKKDKIDELNKEFNSLEQRRNAILKGEFSTLEKPTEKSKEKITPTPEPTQETVEKSQETKQDITEKPSTQKEIEAKKSEIESLKKEKESLQGNRTEIKVGDTFNYNFGIARDGLVTVIKDNNDGTVQTKYADGTIKTERKSNLIDYLNEQNGVYNEIGRQDNTAKSIEINSKIDKINKEIKALEQSKNQETEGNLPLENAQTQETRSEVEGNYPQNLTEEQTARADELLNKAVEDGRYQRQERIDSGMNPDEASRLGYQEWLQTADGQEYASIVGQEQIQKDLEGYETAPTNDTPANGDVSIGDNRVEQNGNTEQQNTAPESLQTANDSGNTKTEVENRNKTFKLRDQEVFYHASPNKRVGRLKPTNAPQFGTGVYFSSDKNLVEQEFGDKNTTEVRLNIENPVYTNTKQWNEVEKKAIELADKDYGNKKGLVLDEEKGYFRYDKENTSEIAEIPSKFISDAAKLLGYDSIIDEGSAQYTDEIVVLDESKIIYPTEAVGNTDAGKSENDVQNQEVSAESTSEKEIKDSANDFKREEGKKSLLSRISTGSDATLKKSISKYSLDYDIENQETAKNNADKFVDEVGVEQALLAVRTNQIVGAEKAFVYNKIIQDISNNISKVSEQEAMELERINVEILGEIANEFDQESRNAGRFISALQKVYSGSQGRYNLSLQIQQYKAKNDGTIPDEILAKFKEANDKIIELEKRLEEAEKIKKDQTTERSIEELIESIARKSKIDKSKGISDKSKAKAFADKLRSFKLKTDGFRSTYGADIIYNNAIELVAKTIETGGKISEAIKQGVKYIREQEVEKEIQDKAIAHLFNAFDQIESQSKGIRIDDDGKLKIPHSIIREKVEGGIRKVEDLVESVKSDLLEIYPDQEFTDREIRDAITDYGKISNPTKDEIEIEISIMKSLGKLISGLEDAYSGTRPLRSGLQRRKPTLEERAMTRKLKELLRDLPMDDADLARSWKTALDGIKTRLTNEIADLDKQIELGEKRKAERKTIEYDEEAKALKSIRDQKKQTLDELVGKPELTEEERIEKATILTQKSIDALQEMITSGEIDYRKKPTPVTSAKLESLREQRKQLQKQIEEMRKEAGLAEMKRLEIAKKTRLTRIEELKRRIRERDFSVRTPKPLPIDQELLDIETKLQEQKAIYERERHIQELNERSVFRKWLSRFVQLLGITRLFKAGGEFSQVLVQQGFVTPEFIIKAPSEFFSAYKADADAKKALMNVTFIRAMYRLGKAFVSPDSAKRYEAEMKANPLYPLMQKTKLSLTGTDHKLDAQEENYQLDLVTDTWNSIGDYIDKATRNRELPTIAGLIKKIIGSELTESDRKTLGTQFKEASLWKMFERGAVTYSNYTKMIKFQQGVVELQKDLKDPINDIEDYKKVANYINVFSGRASLGKAEMISKDASLLIFSLRNTVSQFQQLNPFYYLGTLGDFSKVKSIKDLTKIKPTVAQKMAVKSFMVSFTSIVAFKLAFMAWANAGEDDEDKKWKIETDPRRSDFGKLIKGNQKYDLWHGLNGLFVLYARLFMQQTKSTTTGEVKDLGVGYGSATSSELIVRYATNKLSPTAGYFWRLGNTHQEIDPNTGKTYRVDKYGNVYGQKELNDLFVPIYWNAINEIQKEDPDVYQNFLMSLGFFGMSVGVDPKGEKFKDIVGPSNSEGIPSLPQPPTPPTLSF